MNRSRYYPAVDGLKGLLIFVIVLHNLLPLLDVHPTSHIIDAIPLTSFIILYGGSLGNRLFFILSGFLIATSYREKIRQHSASFADFLGKRLRKLYPVYILSNFVMLVLHVLEYGPSGINLKRIICTALLQLGGGLDGLVYNSPSWFLSTLFLCYIVYFGVSWFASHPTPYLLTLTAGVLVGYALTIGSWSFSILNATNGVGIMNFFLGCIIAELYPRIRQHLPKWTSAACILTLGVSAYLMLRYGIEIIAGDSNLAFSFLFGPGILYLALESRLLRRLFECRPVQLLGKISLTVFFWHYPLFSILRYLLHLFGLGFTELYFPLYLVILVLFCWLYSRYARKPAPANL